MMRSRLPHISNRIDLWLGLAFSRVPISPNAWTVLSVLPAIAGFYILYTHGNMLQSLVLFAFSGIMDAIDGGVARVTGRATPLGAYLDGVIDRIVEGLLLFGLMFYGVADYLLPGYAWVALLLFAGTMFPSFCRAYADHRKAVTDADTLNSMGGVLERAERLMLVFAGMILGYVAAPIYLTYAIAIAVALSVLTVGQRIHFVVKNSGR